MTSFITGILHIAITDIIYIIQTIGYPGIFFLMLLEGLLLPVPSEVVMAFGGYLAITGGLPGIGPIPAYILVIIAGTLGNLVGSSLAYAIGYYEGEPGIVKFGKYVGLDENSVKITHKWFLKYGKISVFGTRMIPIFRTFISIPAGIAKMRYSTFAIYTLMGTIIWDSVLVYLGFILGSRWKDILGAFNDYTYLGIAVFVIVLIYLYARHRSGKLKIQQIKKTE
ncbi:alkaline phosphatase like protein [mine drainage metagenome]|uniref:Alkaline phosphatase like protein n=1 Tax=mine drainage metagenome TaxID=410659 RepID=T1D1Z3_9ZZZZ